MDASLNIYLFGERGNLTVKIVLTRIDVNQIKMTRIKNEAKKAANLKKKLA